MSNTSRRMRWAELFRQERSDEEIWLGFLGFVACLVMLFFVFAWRYHCFIKGVKNSKNWLRAEIIPPKKIIKPYEMRRQDGRVSETAMREYQQYKKSIYSGQKMREYLKRRSARYARLIVEGRQMIMDVNEYAPYPCALISKIPLIRRLPSFWGFTAAGFLFGR